MKPEEKAKKEVKRILEESGCFFFKPQMGGFGKVGIPDFIACVNGYFLAVETKKVGGELTPLQLERFREIVESKGIALRVTEESLEELKVALANLKERVSMIRLPTQTN